MLDELLQGTEHEILRLPPYHAIFNPIEMVWGNVKQYFRQHVGRNNDFSEKMMTTILKEAIEKVTPDVCAKYFRHCEDTIQSYYDREVGAHGQTVEDIKLVIDLDDDGNSDDDDFCDNYGEDVDDLDGPQPLAKSPVNVIAPSGQARKSLFPAVFSGPVRFQFR